MSNFKHIKAAFAALGAALVLAGCASSGGVGQSAEDVVKARADARWRALIAGEYEKAYSFSTPAYREVVKLNGFMNVTRGTTARKNVEVKSASCAESSCDVVVKLFFTPLLGPAEAVMDTEYTERWVQVDGNWYIHQRF